METDANLKQQVTNELKWEPSIDASQIGVIVKNGVVTLTGHVDTYAQKISVEKAVKRVAGVRALAEELEVKIPGKDKRTDEDIALTALNNLKWNSNVPEERIQLKAEDNWITLEGQVDWNYQKEAAKKSIASLPGVRGVTNSIKVAPVVEPRDVKQQIRSAFKRNANIDANHVNVRAEGHKVILSGSVQSWAEKKQAEKAAWSAPGVTNVKNEIEVRIRELTM